MSSLSITGNDQGLVQYYRQLAGNAGAPSVAAPAAAASAAVSSTSAPAGDEVQKGSGGHHHGHGGLFKKIESAVTSALEAAKSDPSADPNKVVEDAIAKVFKDNGGAPAGGAEGGKGGPQSAGADADGDHDGGGQGDGGVNSARQAFTQTLQSFGVDPSKFHSDFLAAVQDAQGGGSSDSSGDLFKSFPPGSNVDTTA
jgi:hypothetical protein